MRLNKFMYVSGFRINKVLIAAVLLIGYFIAPVISHVSPNGKYKITHTNNFTPPTLIGVPSDVTVSCDSVPSPANVSATSSCPGNINIAFNQTQNGSSCPQNYVITRTWTATDNCGEKATATQTITVKDTRAPMLIPVLPALAQYKDQDTVYSDCDNPLLLGVGDMRAMDNCDTKPTVSFVDTTTFKGTCKPGSNYLALLYCAWFATDACGNKSSFTVYVVLVDKKAPVLSGVPNDITLNCNDAIPVPPSNVKAVDNCDSYPKVNYSETKENTNCPNNYALIRKWTATDTCGNVSFKTQKITVVDKEAPVISGVPNNLTINLDNGEVVPNPANPTVSDNCSTTPTLTYGQTSTTVGCGYNLVRTWTATDECGNIATKLQTISVLKSCGGGCTKPIISKASILDAGCGKNNGSIELTISGAAAYTFKWEGSNNNTNILTNLSSGIYHVTVSEIGKPDCFTTGSFTVNNAAQPFVSFTTKDADCGKNNGSATLSPSNLVYNWSDNGSGSSRNNLSAGTYQVTATDSNNGCATFISLSIGTNAGLNTDVVINKKPDCNLSNGSATINVTGGSGKYSFSWGNSNTKTDLKAGNYNVIVQDDSTGCSKAVSIFITNNLSGAIDITIDSIVPVKCIGEKNGSVSYSVSTSGTVATPVSISIVNNLGVSFNKDTLSAGNYCIEVFDANNCLLGMKCFEVTQPDALVLNAAITQKNCVNGGQILLNVKGGNPSYTFDWADISGIDNIKDRYNLNDGNYNVTVTDSKGCTVASNNLIVLDTCKNGGGCISPVISNAIIVNSNCNANDGSISVTVSGTGSYTYNWFPNVSNTNSAKNISQGTYTITITEVGKPDCYIVRSFTVGNNTAINITKEIENSNCGGANGIAVLKPDTGVSYLWNDGSTNSTRTDLLPGIYQVTATETSRPQCIQVLTVNIGNDINLEGRVLVNKDATCGNNNGSATINVTGGSGKYTFSWGASNTKTDLAVGAYPVTITDTENGCKIVVVVTITNEQSHATLSIQPNFKVNCKGDKNLTINYTLTKSPGFAEPETIVIKDLNGVVYQNGNLGAGNYCILVTDANGCSAAVEFFEVSEPNLLQVDITKINPTCDNLGSILLETQGGNGGYIYDWADLTGNNDPEDRLQLNPATYKVTVIDAKGCSIVSPNLVLTKDCNPSTITKDTIYTATNPETPVKICVKTNELKGTITSVAICDQPSNGVLSFTSPDSCVVYTPNKGFNSGSDTMCVVICDDKGICDTTIIVVTIIPKTPCNGITVNSILKESTCNNNDGEIILTASGALNYKYQWSPNVSSSHSASNIPAGIYTITVSDLNNPSCSEVVSYAVTNKNGPKAESIQIENATCNASNGKVTLSPSTLTYTWNDGFVGSVRNDLKSGIYFVTIENSNIPDCKNYLVIKVNSTSTLTVFANTENSECKQSNGKATISVTGGSGNYTYNWSTIGSAGSSIDTLKSGSYVVNVKDNVTNCEGSVLFTILDNSSKATVQVDSIIKLNCGSKVLGSLNYKITKDNNFVGNEVITLINDKGNVVGFNNIVEGSYSLLVSDSLGCAAGVAYFKVVGSELLNVKVTITDANCGKNGKIETSIVSGNGAPYNYYWSDISGTNLSNRSDLSAGNYGLTVVDGLGCTVAINNLIVKDLCKHPDTIYRTTEFETPITICVTLKDFKGIIDSTNYCSLPKNGTISVFDTCVTYTPNAGFVGNDTFCIIFCDNQKICDTVYFIITVKPKNNGGGCNLALSAKVQQPTCGNNDGSIEITASGATTYSYIWDPNVSTTNVATGLGAGSYKITVISGQDTTCKKDTIITLLCDSTGGNGCKLAISAKVKQPTCGNNDGSIEITASGATTYSYVWDPNVSTTNVATGLGAGSYKITVISGQDTTCKKDTIINLLCDSTGGNGCKLAISAKVKQPTCGNNDGSIEITASGATTYSYVWDPNVSTTNVATGLGAGSYKITVISGQDTTCKKDTIITLLCDSTGGNGCKLAISAKVKQPTCGNNDGSIEITASGATTYSYVWDPNVSTTNVATGLGAGSYKITVISGQDTTCKKDTIISLLCDSTGGNGCKLAISAKVKQPTCGNNDGSIEITASGATTYSYVWDPNVSTTNVATGLGAGSYKITVISGQDTTCKKDTIITLLCDSTGGNNCKLAISAKVKDPTCGNNDGSIEITASGATSYKYIWNPNVSTTNSATGLAAGVYKITVISEQDTTCRKDTTITLKCQQGGCHVIITDALILESHCGQSDGSIEVHATGANNLIYKWTPANISTSNIAKNLAAGTYSVTVCDKNDTLCCDKAIFVVGNADGPKATIDSVVAANCASADGKAYLSPSTYKFIWNDGVVGSTRTDLKAGNYQITVVNPLDSNCIDLLAVKVNAIGKLDLTATIDKLSVCKQSNGKATINVLNGSGNYLFSWGSSATKDSLKSGVYSVTVSDVQTGCTGSITFTINDTITGNTLKIIGADDVVLNCIGDINGEVKYTIENFNLNDSLIVTIEDSKGNIYKNNELGIGDYCLIVKDKNGCIWVSKCFKVTAPTMLALNVEVIPEKCKSKGSIELNGNGGNGGYAFNWLDLTTSPEPKDRYNLDAGYYSVTMTDSKGCSLAVDSIFVDNLCKKPKIDTILINLPITKNDTVICISLVELTGPIDSIYLCKAPSKGVLVFNGKDTCLQYVADSTFKTGCDTMCVVVCDTNGVCDTTIIIICKDPIIVICNNYFTNDTIDLFTNTCYNGSAVYCTPFTNAEIKNFNILDNGNPYNGGFVDCNYDTLVAYKYKDIPGEGKVGPYLLNYWGAGKDTFKGNFLDINALLDSMKIWDPNGQWKIDTVGQKLVGGVKSKFYGNMNIGQVGVVGSVDLLPSQELNPKNVGIVLNEGYNNVIFIDKNNGCADTLRVNVIPIFYNGLPILYTTNCDSLAMVCIGINPSDIPKVVILDNGNPYVGPIDTCNITPSLKGIQIKLDTGMHVITFTNIMTGCTDTAMIKVSCNAPKNIVFDTCIVERDSFKICIDVTNIVVDSIKNLCPGSSDGNITYEILPSGLNQVCITIKGAKFGVDTFCLQMCNKLTNICDTFTYRICVLPKIDTIRQSLLVGCSDTICLDTALFKGGVGSIVNICPTLSGTNIQFDTIGNTGCIAITAESLGSDTACIVICDKTGKYCDTTILIINARNPVIDTIRTMLIVGQMDTICLDTSELDCNKIISLKNICEPNTVDNVKFDLFSTSPWCVKITGLKEGKDTACLVLCNQVTCDTTILIVMVNKDPNLLLPIAVNDCDTVSGSFGKSITISVLANDTLNGPLTGIGIVKLPLRGTVAKDPLDSTKFIYTPNKNYCGVDTFTYFIANGIGFDTANVCIKILCDTFIIFNAISPNGDNVNDGFTIIGIENYPGNQVDVFDRWGHRVLCQKNYTNVNAWKGEWDGKTLPDGTYFYHINLGPSAGNKIYTGYLEIRR